MSSAKCSNVQGWASTTVFELLLQLSDDVRLVKRVHDLFVKGLLSCPEVLLCALVRRLQTNAQGNGLNSNIGMQMKGEKMFRFGMCALEQFQEHLHESRSH